MNLVLLLVLLLVSTISISPYHQNVPAHVPSPPVGPVNADVEAQVRHLSASLAAEHVAHELWQADKTWKAKMLNHTTKYKLTI